MWFSYKVSPKKRLLLKISGEFLSGNAVGSVHDKSVVSLISNTVAQLVFEGFQIVVVVGGGNIYRGRSSGATSSKDMARADYIGMSSTIINALVIHAALNELSIDAHVLSSLGGGGISYLYSFERAIKLLNNNSVLVLAGGLGVPYMTTDSTAIVRALELDCSCIVKLTGVPGIFSSDPKKDANAVRYDRIGYDQMISQDLKLIDRVALTIAASFSPKMLVMRLQDADKILNILKGDEAMYDICTFVE